jgi:hypothetical protein
MMRTVITVATTLLVFALVSACAEEEIVLATLPAPSKTAPPKEGLRCVEDATCGANEFCARKGCGEVGGACEPRPVICEEDAAPVCGCDGITYWNDCLRRAAGTTAMTDGECGPSGRLCGIVLPSKVPPGGPPGPGEPAPGAETCPQDTYCARLLGPSGGPPVECPADAPGTCWALPAVCPTVGTGPDRWLACGPPDGCKTTCDAIRSRQPHRRAKACH